MAPESDNERSAFLIEWYKILWNNARNSMDGIWKLMGPITLVGTIWVAVYKEYLPGNLGNSLAFIIIFWAINVTIDFNQWHRRNLIFLTAVEREFFTDKDYGRIIPKKFDKPKKDWIGFYRICGYTFGVLLVLAVIVAGYTFKKQTTWALKWYEHYEVIVLLAGLVFTYFNYRGQEKSAGKYLKELFQVNNEK